RRYTNTLPRNGCRVTLVVTCLLASARLATDALYVIVCRRETADALNYSLSARRYTLLLVGPPLHSFACRPAATLFWLLDIPLLDSDFCTPSRMKHEILKWNYTSPDIVAYASDISASTLDSIVDNIRTNCPLLLLQVAKVNNKLPTIPEKQLRTRQGLLSPWEG
ncbi:hypothetical protein GW17_00060375, partial [Ensete ventricosum]